MTKRVVIVGAGAAGVAAGNYLRDHGVQVVLLEARARVGGRAYTETQALNAPVDLGCGWLHCADTNPWTHYARANGFEIIERDPIWRQRVGARQTTAEEQASWAAAWERNESLIAASVQSGTDQAVSEVVPHDEFRPAWDAAMTWLMGSESEKISCVDFDRYVDTHRNWPVKQGLGSVIAHAATSLDIRLNTVVNKVDWSRREVALQTSGGTIACDFVIVTAPTTVLANEGIRFFPALPANYRDAFAGIPLGLANKVFFSMAGPLPFEGTTHFIGTERSARTGSYAVRPNGHDVLLAYFGGSLARELEMRNELATFARDELQSIFGKDFVSRIKSSVHSGWATDPFAAGAYSVALPGKADLRAQLSEPVGERIFFAGEANSIDHFGTIHGAWESAIASAQRAIAAR